MGVQLPQLGEAKATGNSPPSLRGRILIATIAAIVYACLTRWLQHYTPGLLARDFTWAWRGARSLLEHSDPYTTIRVAGGYPFDAPFMYPLTSAIVAVPLAWLSAENAALVFISISVFWLCFGLTRTSIWHLWALASAPAIIGLTLVQSLPLLTAAATSAVPAVAFLFLMKPTVGLALFARRPSVGAAVSCVVLLGLSVAILPTWPVEWIRTVNSSPTREVYFSPLRMAPAFLLLLAIFKWRRPEGRLLAVLACVPQAYYFYDQLPLMLIPRSKREMMLLVFGSLIACLMSNYFSRPEGLVRQSAICAPWILGCMYLPCLIMLMRRPNEGRIPEWLERRVVTFLPPMFSGRQESEASRL